MIIEYNRIVPTIGKNVFIAPTAVLIGDVTIGDGASIWFNAVLRGDMAPIEIGTNTNIQDNCTVHTDFGKPAIIGDDVTVGHNAVVHGCTIGAGSLVVPGKQLQGGYLWVGSPARKIRPLTEQELEYLEYSAQHYVNLKDKYR